MDVAATSEWVWLVAGILALVALIPVAWIALRAMLGEVADVLGYCALAFAAVLGLIWLTQ